MARKKTQGNEPRKNILTASLLAGKGRVAVFDGPAILAMYSPLRSHTRFCDQPQTGYSPQLDVNWTGPHRLSLKHDSFRNSNQLNLPLWHRRERRKQAGI